MMNIFSKQPLIKSVPLTPQPKCNIKQFSHAQEIFQKGFNIKKNIRRHSQNKLQCFDFTDLNPQIKQIQNQDPQNQSKKKQKPFRFQNIYKKQYSFRQQQNQIVDFICKKNIQIIKENIKKMQQNENKSSYFQQRIKSRLKPSFNITMRHNFDAQKLDQSKNNISTFRFTKQSPQKKMKKAISFIEERKKQFQIKNNCLKQKRKTENNLSNKKIKQKADNEIFGHLSYSHLNLRISKPKTTGGWLVKYKHPDTYFS